MAVSIKEDVMESLSFRGFHCLFDWFVLKTIKTVNICALVQASLKYECFFPWNELGYDKE